ncbi:hypothetical protein IWX77_000675 [Cryobacterium sp. CAN_C2]
MVRTLVAVGTVKLVTMFVARDFAIPRSGETLSCLTGLDWSTTTACGLVTGASAGTGTGLGALDVVRAVGWFSVTGADAVAPGGVWATGAGAAGAATGAGAAGAATGAGAAGAATGAGAAVAVAVTGAGAAGGAFAAGVFAVWW